MKSAATTLKNVRSFATCISDWRAAHERGELVLGGAMADPIDGAMLVFRGPSPEAAEAFAKADPYVTNGLVTKWSVRKWNTVVGDGATVG